MRIFLPIFYLLFTSVFVQAQSLQNQLSSDGKWVITTYNSLNGIPQNTINHITKDKNGMFWLSTQDGVVRFDGQKIKTFATSNLKGFNQSRIRVLSHLNDTILIGGNNPNDSTLAYIIDNKLQGDLDKHFTNNYFVIKNKVLPKKYFQSVLNDYSKAFFYQTVYVENGEKSYLGVSKNNTSYELYDSKGRQFNTIKIEKGIISIPVQYRENIFAFFKNGTFIKYEPKANRIINGKFIFKGLKKSDFKDLEIIINSNPEYVFAFRNNTLYKMDDDLNNNEGIIHFESIASNVNLGKVICVYYDKANETILLGTATKGFWVLRKRYYQVVAGSNNLVNAHTSIIEGNNDEVISSNHTDLLLKVPCKSLKYSILFDYKKTKETHNTLWKDKNNRIWAKIQGEYTNKIGYYDINFKRFHSLSIPSRLFDTILNPTRVLGCVNTSDGQIWMVTPPGVSLIKDNKLFAVASHNWSKELLYTVICDNNDVLWIGAEKGLYQFDTQKNVFRAVEQFNNQTVRALKCDEDNGIWIGTYGNGFYYLKDGNITKFPLDSKEILRNTHAFVEDKKGCFWITTNQGLFRINKQILINYTKQPNTTTLFYHYETLYGQPTDEFNGGDISPMISTQNGTFVAASMAGLVFFNPDKIPILCPTNPVVIDKITLQQQDTLLENNTTLSADFGRLTVELSQAFLGHPYNQKIEYRLLGFDKGWLPYNTLENLSYTQLSTGKYVLQVRYIKDNLGVYEYQNLLTFYVANPWYLSKIAFLLYVLGTALSIFCITIIRTKRISQKNKELKRLVAIKTEELRNTIEELELSNEALEKSNEVKHTILGIVAHDMKTPLLFMYRVAKNITTSRGTNSQELMSFIEKVGLTAQQLNQWLATLLDWVRTNEIDFSYRFSNLDVTPIIKEVLLLYQSTAEAKNILIHANINDSCIVWGDEHWLRILCNNIIENSIKYTKDGTISIDSYRNNRFTYIVFSDSGQGMDEETLQQLKTDKQTRATLGTHGERGLGLGFAIINNIVSEHGGTIGIASEKGKGTTITIGIPNKLAI